MDRFTFSFVRTRMASENHNQENQTNSLREHHMESAIETVLSNKEQSYEDFMGCFMALKKGLIVMGLSN